jgi:hypothetical protein
MVSLAFMLLFLQFISVAYADDSSYSNTRDGWFGNPDAWMSGWTDIPIGQYGWDLLSPNCIYASRFYVNVTCELEFVMVRMKSYVYNTAEVNVKFAVYNYTDDDLLAETEERAHSDTNDAYWKYDFLSTVTLTNGTYFIAFWQDGGTPGTGQIQMWWATNNTGTGQYDGSASPSGPVGVSGGAWGAHSYGSWPNPMVWDAEDTTRVYRMWVEFDLPEWHTVENWWGSMLVIIGLTFHLNALRWGLLMGGLIMFAGPLMYIAHEKTSIGAVTAIDCMLIIFIGIGLLIGFSYT